MTDPLADAEQAIARGDVPAARAALEAMPAEGTASERLRWGLVATQVRLLAGDSRAAARRSRELLAQARALADRVLEVEALLVHAQVAAHLRREADVRELLQRAAQLAPADSEALARVRARQVLHAVLARDFDQAHDRIDEAQARFTALGNAEGQASLELSRANALAREQRLDEALEALEVARPVLMEGPPRSTRAGWYSVMAQVAFLQGDSVAAQRHLASAHDLYARLALAPQQADCATNLAEVMRSQGDLEGARAQYLRLLASDDDPARTFFPRMNLALCELALGHDAEAASIATALLADEAHDRSTAWVDAVLHAITMVQLPTEAEALDALAATEQALRSAPRVVDPDVPEVLRRVRERMAARGWVDLAARVGSMALDHYVQQGCDPQAEAEREALLALRARGASAWLGGLRLQRTLGKGGMGEVYEGLDTARGLPVAVKVIRSDGTSQDTLGRAVASLEHEMRGVAGLDHPGIVDVIATGVVSPGAAALAKGQLVAGSPWVAMELVSGGTLRRLRGRVDWPTLRGVLLALLDALAHAHARGLVHLDLKPANVLVDRTAGIAVKLTDFGISRGFREPTARTLDAGTPRYMAPEQFRGDGRLIGPWTDLYALGCVAMELAAGRAPFLGSPEALREAHLHQAPPPLEARCAVPVGFEAWLGRLLCKHPLERFLRAADAALALRRLDAHELLPPSGAPPAPSAPLASDTFVLDDLLAEAPDASEVPAAVELAPVPRPRCPAFTEVPRLQRVRRGMVAMFADRTPRVLGQRAAKQALWEALRTVHTEGRVGWVEVAAPDGVAGARGDWLVRWLIHRGHEVGALSPIVLEAGGLPERALRGPLGAAGLHGEALVRHLEVRGRQWGCDRGMLQRLARSLDEGRVIDEAAAWIAAVTRERPVVWSAACPPEALRARIAGWVGQPWPLLVVTRVDPLDPGEVTGIAAPLTIAAEPVPGHVLRTGLGTPRLSATLAYELAELCEGCDAAAHTVLAHHVARAEVVEGHEGLVRRPGWYRELRLPSEAAWVERVAAWQAQAPAELWEALETVCAAPGAIPPGTPGLDDVVLHRLAARGWVRRDADGWWPRVAAVRQRVLDRLRDEGRLARLSASWLPRWRADAKGRAALLQRAGQAEPSEVAWRDAIREALAAGDRAQADAMLRRWRRVARQLGLARTDPRREDGEALARRVEAAGDT